MKHRLPKPRSDRPKKRAAAQAELPMNGGAGSAHETDPGEERSSLDSPHGAPHDAPAADSPPAETRAFQPARPLEEPEPVADNESFILPQQRAYQPPPLPKKRSPEAPSPADAKETVKPHPVHPAPHHPPVTDEEFTEENMRTVISAEGEAARVTPPPLPFQPPSHEAKPADENAPLLIQTHGLVKQYGGRRVVNGVDIHVRAGEVVGLLGKNGAGKTTTFYMIVGLVAPTEGHVYMGEEDVTRMPMYRRARRGIGYLPQEESIFRKLTVEENLLAILETLPMGEEEREARCNELLRDFGLEHVRDNIALTLSGGEKRRVTIARALVTSPTLLLLDEPFSGVDPMAVHDIQEIILHLKERGLGVLITDHNVRETLSVVDRAYIINEGRVLSQGSRDFLINDPVAREIYLGHRFSM